jgi:hypothetical protein
MFQKSPFLGCFPLKKEAFPGIIIVTVAYIPRRELLSGQVYLIIISAADLMEILSAGG